MLQVGNPEIYALVAHYPGISESAWIGQTASSRWCERLQRKEMGIAIGILAIEAARGIVSSHWACAETLVTPEPALEALARLRLFEIAERVPNRRMLPDFQKGLL